MGNEFLNNVPAPKTERRIQYLDIARTIAIICVVLNHAVNRSYTFTHDEFVNISFISSLFESVIGIVSRFGVPLFLMISGVLIVNKDFSSKEKVLRYYKRNLIPLLITTEIWLFIMYWYKNIFAIFASGLSIHHFIHCLSTMLFINQNTMGSMWYMPMIICVYLLIPVFSIAKDKLPW